MCKRASFDKLHSVDGWQQHHSKRHPRFPCFFNGVWGGAVRRGGEKSSDYQVVTFGGQRQTGMAGKANAVTGLHTALDILFELNSELRAWRHTLTANVLAGPIFLGADIRCRWRVAYADSPLTSAYSGE